MDNLPIELVDIIIDCLSDDARSSKNLRMTARRFSRTVRNVFSSLILYQHQDKWQNLNQIAQDPALAIHVHTIKLLSIAKPANPGSFRQFERNTIPFRSNLDDSSDLSLSSRSGKHSLREAYKAATYWYTGHEGLESWVDQGTLQQPPLRLDNLANFNRLEVIGHSDLCKFNDPSHEYGLQLSGITRQEAATLTFAKYPMSPEPDLDHIKLFLKARQQCGKYIPDLALGDVREIFVEPVVSYYPVHRVIPGPSTQLPGLKKLEIDVSHMSAMHRTMDYDWTPLTLWATDLSSIETLIINEGMSPYRVLLKLRQIVFPNLKFFTTRYVSTYPRTLVDFIRRHNTLESIEIDQPCWTAEDWDEFHTMMAGSSIDGVTLAGGAKLHLDQAYPEHLLNEAHCARIQGYGFAPSYIDRVPLQLPKANWGEY